MSSPKLYSEVVRPGSSDEDAVSPGRNQHGIRWLVEYQQESEEVALEKTLQLSKVKFSTV